MLVAPQLALKSVLPAADSFSNK